MWVFLLILSFAFFGCVHDYDGKHLDILKNLLPNTSSTDISEMDKVELSYPYILNIPNKWNKKCIIFVHGLGGSKEKWSRDMEFFAQYGYGSIAIDFPYGGKFDFNKLSEILVEGSEEILKAEKFCREKGSKEVYLVARSLGTRVAALALPKSNITKAVLLMIPANDSFLQNFSKVPLSIDPKLDPLFYLPGYHGSVQFHCGIYDEIVPPESCKSAYLAAGGKKEIFWYPSGHVMPLEKYGNRALAFFEGKKSCHVYVSIVMHSEDPYHPSYPDFRENKTAFFVYRDGLFEFASLLKKYNVTFDFQPDWNFLEGCRKWEGKNNIIKLLYEMGVEIDPHSHENEGYNYADIACLIEMLGAKPSSVVGGHVFDPTDPHYQNWPRFESPVKGNVYNCTWNASILWGESRSGHRGDPVVSGVWRPSKEDFFMHDASGKLITIGRYKNSIQGIYELLDKCEPSGFYTSSVFVGHTQVTSEEFRKAWAEKILPELLRLQSEGKITLMTLEEIAYAWQLSGSQPTILKVS